MRICDGRVVIITGAGRGLGRAHALAFAAEGAKVVVNDVGASLSGEGRDLTPAAEVVAEIESMGGEAIVNDDDVSDWDGAGRMIRQAIDTFGHLDTLVCNAGIVRDRMIVNMSVDEWDAVMKVHLRGMFCPVRQAVVAAAELDRYGVKINGIAPSARSRMTEEAFADMMKKPDSGFDAMDPANVSPVVVWLGSSACEISGRMFETAGGELSVADGWQHGQPFNKGARYEPAEIGAVVADLIREAPKPAAVYGAN